MILIITLNLDIELYIYCCKFLLDIIPKISYA